MNPAKSKICIHRHVSPELHMPRMYFMIPDKVSSKPQPMADETGRAINFEEEVVRMPPSQAEAYVEKMRRCAQFCAAL